MEQDPITAETRLDLATISRGRHWHERRNPLQFYGMPLMGLVMVLFALWSLYTGQTEDDLLDRLLLAVGLVILFRRWIHGWMFRKSLRQMPQFGEVMQWRFTETGFTQVIGGSEANVEWDVIPETVSTPEGFLLYPRRNHFFWIPRTGFSSREGAERFQEILAHHTPHRHVGG